MGDAPNNSTAIAYLHMADVSDHLNEQWVSFFYQGGSLYLPLAHCRTDRQVAVFWFDVAEFRNVVDVNNVCWPCESHVEQRDQALSPCQYLGVFPILVEKIKRFVKHVGSTIA